jgi:hypothetical protein
MVQKTGSFYAVVPEQKETLACARGKDININMLTKISLITRTKIAVKIKLKDTNNYILTKDISNKWTHTKQQKNLQNLKKKLSFQ